MTDAINSDRLKPKASSKIFAIERSAAPMPEQERLKALEDPQFGKIFTDHMVTIQFNDLLGWHEPRVGPYQNLSLDPSAAVLHYGQEIFEGMKAYRTQSGDVVTFRTAKNAGRMRDSARRMAMPEIPEALFLAALEAFLSLDHCWVPSGEGTSLYLRPFMIATEPLLGVRASKDYMFVLIATPAGTYFDKPCVSIWVTDTYTRAAVGGTGAAKCGGNYAAGLLAQQEAAEQECDQVIFLDAASRKYIEELGGMNVVFVRDDDTLVTPALTNTILPGITRDAVMTLASHLGYKVEEARISIDEVIEGAATGRYAEAFACGTAAVISPIGQLKRKQGSVRFGDGETSGPITSEISSRLKNIQRGLEPDLFGWVHAFQRAT